MTPQICNLTAEALKLPDASRARLAEVLLESLGEEVTSESDADRKLLAEADRRYRELVSGQVIGRSWEDVLAIARTRLGS